MANMQQACYFGIWSRPMIDLDDLNLAYMAVSSEYDNTVYIHKPTGKIYIDFDLGDNPEPLPDDIESDDYVAMPSRVELGLGRDLAIRFTREHLEDNLDYVYDIFRRKGAFANFKYFLEKHNMLVQWHQYNEAAEDKAIREWCVENGLVINK
jgi:hypothetical protein